MSFWIGTARTEITPKSKNIAMMGWGDVNHLVKGLATPLYARTLVIQNSAEKRMIWVCLDICFVSELLRQKILERTQVSDHELLLTATHTHSAPAGYSSSVFYNLTNDGYIPEVLESYVSGVSKSIQAALKNRVPGKIKLGFDSFDLNTPVAFNRSLRAWNRNSEISTPIQNRNEAVDREMSLLRFEKEDGTPLASWSWFAVHATSIHKDSYLIHGDNKGLASLQMEAHYHQLGHADFVAVFAQGAAGDVTPNFKFYNGIPELRGSSPLDQVSCEFNARLQSDFAIQIFEKAKTKTTLDEALFSFLEYHDFADQMIDPEFAQGQSGLTTRPGIIGLPQIYGTAEGRGTPAIVIRILACFIRFMQILKSRSLAKDPFQGPKLPLIHLGERKAFGLNKLPNFKWVDFLHPTLKTYRRFQNQPLVQTRAFAEHILPLQLQRIGNILFASLPAEFTTMSGRRVKAMLLKEWQAHGIEKVILHGYSNSHTSYVTTPEEYEAQVYEGGCTHFGKYTLLAYLSLFKRLTLKIQNESPLDTLKPTPISAEYLKAIEIPLVKQS